LCPSKTIRIRSGPAEGSSLLFISPPTYCGAGRSLSAEKFFKTTCTRAKSLPDTGGHRAPAPRGIRPFGPTPTPSEAIGRRLWRRRVQFRADEVFSNRILVLSASDPSFPYPACVALIALTLIRSHIAAARILLIGTRHTALIGLQQMTLA